MRSVRDSTGRFAERPHYEPRELDNECEEIICRFLERMRGVQASFPVTTDELTKLIESEADDLDLYADLSSEGEMVEGVTEFRIGRRPRVLISRELSEASYRENRLRTTLAHEYGHVRFHRYLFELEAGLSGDSRKASGRAERKTVCKRDTMLGASEYDWMEWQAGYICGALLMPATYVRRQVEREGFLANAAAPFSPTQADRVVRLISSAFLVSELAGSETRA